MRRLRGALVLVALSCLVCSSSRPEKGLFDPNPRHPANRLYRNLSTRITQEGDIYDQESIDPVFFPSAKFLTDGESHRQALAALDDFTQHQAKQPLKDPLRRAVLQHDLWGVFVTTTGQAQQEMLETRDGRLVRTERFLDGGDEALERVRQRRKLQRRLAAAMRAIALTAEEIDALPDNLAGAVKAGVFPREFDPGRVKQPFLPADLLAPSGPWIAVTNATRADHLAAPQHTAFTKGRSVFTIFLRLPGGRRATEKYFRDMEAAVKGRKRLPPLPEGAQTALLRRMLLVDAAGKLRATRLTQSLQIRVYHKNDLGHPFAFKLRRANLFAKRNGGLHAVTDSETTYFDFQVRGGGAVDPFEVESKKRWRAEPLMGTCRNCHERHEGRGIYSVNAVYTGAEERTGLAGSDPKEQAKATIAWHRHTYTWGLLQGLWGARER